MYNPYPQAGLPVMLADDDDGICAALSRALQGAGYDVVAVAHDGLEACRLLPQAKPEVLVLDIVMPHMDGFGVMECAGKMKDPPVTVIYSAISHDSVTLRAMDAGASMYFAKPMDPCVLVSRIDGIFRLSLPERYTRHTEEKLLQRTRTMLRELTIPPQQLGYKYLLTSISLMYQHGCETIGSIYKQVAAQHSSTASSVERCMRHSIESAWNRCHPDIIEAYFGYTVKENKDKPTNNEFICMLADRLGLTKGGANNARPR